MFPEEEIVFDLSHFYWFHKPVPEYDNSVRPKIGFGNQSGMYCAEMAVLRSVVHFRKAIA